MWIFSCWVAGTAGWFLFLRRPEDCAEGQACFTLPSSLAEGSWLLPDGAGSVGAGRGPAPGTQDLFQSRGSPPPLHLPQADRLAGPGAWVRWALGAQGTCRVQSGDPRQWVLMLPSLGGPAQGSDGLMQ